MVGDLKGEGDCPYCGKHYKSLSRHKCPKEPEKTKPKTKKTKKTVKKREKTTIKTKKTVKKDDDFSGEATTLVERDEYLSAGVHIGTKNKTAFMNQYIYKIRPDGLAIFDVKKIDERLKMVCDYLSKFKPDEIFIACKRDKGEKPLKLLSMATGIKVSVGRYLPGTLTNPNNDYYLEPKIVFVTDAWYDKQVIKDALQSGAVIISLCNTQTVTANIDIAVPCNNRSNKSLALIFWIIANEYAKNNKLEFNYSKEQFRS